jgi:hypothetical protein
MKARARIVLTALVSMAGCGDAGGFGGFGRIDAGPDGGGAGPLPSGFCAETCATREPTGCLAEADCRSACEKESAASDAAVGGAFAKCVSDEPLCFETVSSCMLRTLHALDANVTVAVSGSGFEAHEGKVLRAWHDPGRERPFGGETTIAGGRFSLEWVAPIGAASTEGPLLLLYIDDDRDARCSPAGDLTHSGYAAWDGNHRAPSFRMVVTPPLLSDAAFVCEYAP